MYEVDSACLGSTEGHKYRHVADTLCCTRRPRVVKYNSAPKTWTVVKKG